MIAQHLIEDARAAGVVLEVENGSLVVEAEHEPPDALIAELRLHKAEVIALLASRCEGASTPQTPTAFSLDEERAAIVEHGGTAPRAWAEGYTRLDPGRPPADVPLGQWQQFVDDVGAFIDSPFCGVAVALGWTPHDLFGCDHDRPFARLDRAGLLWFLDGNKLVALTTESATIETRTGARHTYRRKQIEPTRALAWECGDRGRQLKASQDVDVSVSP